MDVEGDGRTPVVEVACHAPFVAMEFDPFGNVQACCSNALYPLGNVNRQSLSEIWAGARATTLRDAIRAGDLTLGCHVCRYRWMHADGEAPSEYYDELPVESLVPEWPRLLCFSLHNTCNLACIMCGADASSKIRSTRTDLAPLPHLYGDQFFDQVRPFLEHAELVDLVGGEPFLVREHRRIWDLLEDLDHRPRLSLTTNGTIWNDHVESVLARFDTSICVSIDGVTPETFERVRAGARFDEVMANLDRFQRYAAERGTSLHLSFSMVRQNWFELGDVLCMAEERGMDVSVQTVIEADYGVQHVPTPELEEVVATLRRQDEWVRPRLDRNRSIWDRQVARLVEELDRRRTGTTAPALNLEPDRAHAGRVAAAIASVRGRAPSIEVMGDRPPIQDDLLRWASTGVIGRIGLGPDGEVVDIDVDAALGAPLGELAEPSMTAVLHALEAQRGVIWLCDEQTGPGRADHLLWFGSPHRDKYGFVLRLVAVGRADGADVWVAADHSHLPPADVTPVRLGRSQVARRSSPAISR